MSARKEAAHMTNYFFTLSILDIGLPDFMLCTAASLVFGGLVALLHMYKNSYSKNFILTLIILPAIVQAVIMLVNGNLGTGVAVLGAFSLIRFRSAEGNSREITSLFLAMSIGLATGLGCIGVAGLLLIAIGAAILLVQTLPFSGKKESARLLTVFVPADTAYETLFDSVFSRYTKSFRLVKVEINGADAFCELQYLVYLKEKEPVKTFLDEIRGLNHSLPVSLRYLPSIRGGL